MIHKWKDSYGTLHGRELSIERYGAIHRSRHGRELYDTKYMEGNVVKRYVKIEEHYRMHACSTLCIL